MFPAVGLRDLDTFVGESLLWSIEPLLLRGVLDRGGLLPRAGPRAATDGDEGAVVDEDDEVLLLLLLLWVSRLCRRSSSLSLLPREENPEMSKSATAAKNEKLSGPRGRSGLFRKRETTILGT